MTDVKIPVDGYEVMTEWPEFRAFAKRLGIDTSQSVKVLEIRLAYGEVVSIRQEFNGVDAAKGEDRH